MSRHATVWVGGRDVTADTLGECDIQVGRSSYNDSSDASTLSLSMEWPVWAATPAIGDPVHVLGWLPNTTGTERALFAGAVTDVAVEGDVVSILAVDPARTLDGILVGDDPWPMESWDKRFGRVLHLAGQLLPEQEQWLRPGTLLPAWAQELRHPWRDVDRKPVLDLLAELLEPLGSAWSYQPHQGRRPDMAHPGDPARWQPTMRVVHLLWPDPLADVTIGAQLIDADSPPRTSMNLGGMCNEWTIRGVTVGSDGKPLQEGGEWQVSAALPLSARRRYGPSSQSVSTGLAWLPGDTAHPRPDWLPGEMLNRTGYPTWAVDGVIIPLDQAALAEHPQQARDLWMELLWMSPAGALGAAVSIPDVRPSRPRWVLEGLRVAWSEDGWELELLGLTDNAVYTGRAVLPPVDPRNPVSLAAPLPAVIGTGGVLVQPLLHLKGEQGYADGWWRVVAPGEGVQGQDVPNRGVGTMVPTPPLPVGEHLLVVQWLPFGGATAPSEWLELPVVVGDGLSWDDMADTWDALGDLTWDEVM